MGGGWSKAPVSIAPFSFQVISVSCYCLETNSVMNKEDSLIDSPTFYLSLNLPKEDLPGRVM